MTLLTVMMFIAVMLLLIAAFIQTASLAEMPRLRINPLALGLAVWALATLLSYYY